MEKIRAFIAAEIPDRIRLKMGDIEAVLKRSSSAPVKWVDPGSIHLTLKFLGDTDTGIIDEIVRTLDEVISPLSAPALEVRGLGVFPNPQKTQIIWAGLSGDLQGLGRMQQSVESAMEPFGFPREKRSFSPHLTLGRVRDHALPAERQNLGDIVKQTAFEAGTFTASPVHLIKSVLTRQGPVYTRLASFIPR